MFYKYINEQSIRQISFPYKLNNKLYFGYSKELKVDGIYPLEKADMPEEEGFYFTPIYSVENDKIKLVWERYEVITE